MEGILFYICNMKFLRVFLAVVAVFVCLVSCAPWGMNDGNDDSAESSTMKIMAEDISSIAPYAYENEEASSVSSLSRVSVSYESYLSYTKPGSVVFEPLVFESDNGKRFVFKGAELRNLGDGILFCDINSLQEISREPVVHFEETGELDDNGNPILQSSSVVVTVHRDYGNNSALIDTKSDMVYLFSNSGLWVPTEDERYKCVFSSDSYIFVIARERFSNGNELTLYQIDKREMGNSSLNLVPKTVSSVFSISWIDDISDDYAIVRENSDWFTYYLLDFKNNLSPSIIKPDDFASAASAIMGFDPYWLPFSYSWDYSNTIVEGDYVYNFTGGSFYGYALKVDNGRLSLVNAYDLTAGDRTISGDIKMVSRKERDGGIEAVILLLNSRNDYLFRVFCKDGNIDYELINVPNEYGPVTDCEIVDGTLWWIGNANNQDGSSFCYIEPGSSTIKSIPVPGKPIANGDFTVRDDGSFVFWQYLGSTEIGTFTWNPKEPETEPKMLMMQQAETASVISLDSI